MKIGVYSICRDEAKQVPAFLESVQGADHLTIMDTGSTDGTGAAFRAHDLWNTWTCEIHRARIDPWRFDSARNAALALVPADVDVCIRLDLDERLDPGWRAAIETAWRPGITQLFYDFNHFPGYTFRANYVHARHGFIWRGRDHEGLYREVDLPHQTALAPGLSITHHQDRTKPRTAILDRLKLQVREDKRARTLWYLGREYFYYRLDQPCIDTFQEYLKQPDATWDAERMDAMVMMSQAYQRLKNMPKAIEWGYKAIAEYNTREPMLSLASIMAEGGNKEIALGLTLQALKMSNKLTSMYVKPEAWGDKPFEFAKRLATELGLHDLLAILEDSGLTPLAA